MEILFDCYGTTMKISPKDKYIGIMEVNEGSSVYWFESLKEVRAIIESLKKVETYMENELQLKPNKD